MTNNSQYISDIDVALLDHCKRLVSQLNAGIISFPEFSYNITLEIIALSDSLFGIAIITIPDHCLIPYLRFLCNFLKPVDFMPCPKPFIAGTITDNEVALMQKRLRPKYISLYEMVERQASFVVRKNTDVVQQAEGNTDYSN